MEARTIGTTGTRVSPLGLGCMGMSWGYAESGRDDAASIRVIREALDAGVQLIDTARVYGDGHNERLVGDAIRGRRGDVVIASKGGMTVDLASRRMRRDGRPEALRQHVEDGLTHLGVDRIDLYYLHRIDPNVPLAESWGALANLVAEGKLGSLGLSEVTIGQAETAHAIHPVAAIQSELSVWTRDPITGGTAAGGDFAGGGSSAGGNLLHWTREHDVAFVPFAPLGRGYLTGTLDPGTFEASDFRTASPRFTAEAFAHNQTISDTVAGIAEAHCATSAQVALSWLLGLGEHIIPIPGTRKSAHLRDNLGALELLLTDDERQTLDTLPAPSGSRY
ncbi:aldo/keto reductase [Micropruina sp.]|uniref:aldo/keto reductase n=1 Tax=Micropruina sp. TaxID=2737536 RepID=UPI0039E3C3CB